MHPEIKIEETINLIVINDGDISIGGVKKEEIFNLLTLEKTLDPLIKTFLDIHEDGIK